MANIYVRRGPLWIRYRTLLEIDRGRGSQLEFQSPLPIRILTFKDGVLSATGTGVATFIGESQADSSL